jgi:serine/threonine protein phosphatase PrpC
VSGTLDPGATLAPTANALTWTVLAGTAKGSAHDAATPNQDAYASRDAVLPGAARALIVAVADGHGGQRYVRSATGARLAVDTALDVVEAELMANQPGRRLEAVLRDATPKIVAQWRRDVQEDATLHPFTDVEQARARDPLDGDPLISYGSTLIIALARGADVAIAQLGDGDALVRLCGDTIDSPIPGDDRLVAGETTSLCLPSAVEDFRYAGLPGTADCDLVLLASDGYGNAFAAPTWRTDVLTDLGDFLAEAGPQRIAEQLPDWLAESAMVGGDDVTVTLLVREPSADAPARSDPPTPASPLNVEAVEAVEAVERPGRRRIARRVLAILVALTFLAAAALVLHLITSGPDAKPSSTMHALAADPVPAPPEDGART